MFADDSSLNAQETSQSHAAQRDAATSSATAIRQQPKTRKRKGSLRKTALLGTGKIRMDMQNHEASASPASTGDLTHGEDADSPEAINVTTSRRRGNHTDSSYGSSETTQDSWTLPPASHPLKLNIGSIDTTVRRDHDAKSPETATTTTTATTLLSPIVSPTSRYASTTDDDDGLHLNITSAADLSRRRSLRTAHAAVPPPARVQPQEHSYAETEWWGWIILIVTWIVFVVGMGSCLDVWSWAWDVGETPYAPPELEDDPTLPIVGYYPALIVMTGVMAWVWVVVAWVGMKYFRHARFELEAGEQY